MRILLACEFYYPSIGGVQEVMRQLAERLARAGHEVGVATSYVGERQSRSINGVRIEEFHVSGNVVTGLKGELDRYRAYVVRQEYDVLMIKAAQQWTFDALLPILRDIRRPKVFVPCGFSGLFDPRYTEYFERMPDWLREFDQLIFYGSNYRDVRFARKHGLTNITILPNGADEREFSVERDAAFRSRYDIPEDAFVVMTVGSVTGFKGHVEVAKAFERCSFSRSPACLLLIGNVPIPEQTMTSKVELLVEIAKGMYRAGGAVRVAKWLLRPMLVRIGLHWLLVLLGYPAKAARPETLDDVLQRINAMPGRKAVLLSVPRAEVIQAYLNSNLFVFASQIECSPLVLFEAAAAGLPFLTVPVGNASEIAQWTGGGVICDAEQDALGHTRVDPTVLAKQIEQLAIQPQRLACLGAQGRRAWQERFTWDKIVRVYEKVFQECFQKTRA
jgi:glycosyltransferase involved in cell wall biosynthesis